MVSIVKNNKRDHLVNYFKKHNFNLKRYFYPGIHRSEPYVSDPKYMVTNLPNTEVLSSSVLCLPSGFRVNNEVINQIVNIMKSYLKNA